MEEVITRDELNIITGCVNIQKMWSLSNKWQKAIPEILKALEMKKEFDDIKNMMNTSEYLYSGEFAKQTDDRLRELLKQPKTEQVK